MNVISLTINSMHSISRAHLLWWSQYIVIEIMKQKSENDFITSLLLFIIIIISLLISKECACGDFFDLIFYRTLTCILKPLIFAIKGRNS